MRSKGNNTWQVAVYLGTKDGDGKYQRVFRTVHGTRRDAESVLNEMLVQVQNNTLKKANKKLTLGEYLLQWLFDYGKSNLKPTTYVNYEGVIRGHLIPGPGNISLSKLQPSDIQKYFTKTLESGRKDGKGGLSRRYVRYHYTILKEALKHAVKWELVGRNVADATEPPKKEDYEGETLNEQQILELLGVAKNTDLYVPILLAVATGMRRGEVLGLRWQDIDFKTFRIHVKQTVLPPLANGQPVFVSTPKSKKSKRTVTLPQSIIPDLKKHKTLQGKQKMSCSDIYQDNDLVVCRLDGTPMNPGTFSHEFGNLLDRHGLPHVRFHDLRHTHASRFWKAV